MTNSTNRSKINLALWIDYCIFLPICFLLSIFNFIRSLFAQKTLSNEPKKILVIKLTEIGAIILSSALLRLLKEKYPQSEIFFLTLRRNEQIFSLWQEILPEQNILTINDKSNFDFIKNTIQITSFLRQNKIDVVVDLEFFSRFTSVILYLTGAAKRIGFYRYGMEGLYRGNLLTHRLSYNPGIHVGQLYLSMMQVISKDEKKSPELKELVRKEDIQLLMPEISLSEKEMIKKKFGDLGININNKLILMNPGEGFLPLREWPLENFIEVGNQLLKDQSVQIVLVGEKGNKDEQLKSSLNSSRCINLTGQTTIKEVIVLLESASALVCNDCGLAHLAGLTQAPSFVIFGPETPTVFKPLSKTATVFYSGLPCSPCLSIFNHRQSFCQDNVCIKMISPAEVMGKIKERIYPPSQNTTAFSL